MNPAESRSLPRAVRRLVYDVLAEERHPQWIETDDDLDITRVMGATLIDSATPGVNLVDALPCVAGAEAIAPVAFPKVNIDRSRILDVHIFKRNPGFEVLLLDATEDHDSEQRLQQQSNEVALLNRRLKKLTAELERAHAAAEAASAAKSKFIAGMSHEFRTPLTSILGFSDLMQRGISAPRESIDSIHQSAGYLLSLVDNLLEHGALEQGAVQLHREPVHLQEFFASLERLADPLARRKGLEFRLAGGAKDSPPAWARIDPVRLRQIIINLISNAVRYTPDGSVTLTWSLEDETLQVAVADTGPGISEQDIQRIFLPFTRASQGEYHSKSLGLGLSICRQLVDAMDGQLSVTSAPGRGSEFSFRVAAPLVEDPARMIEAESETATQARRILVVDDDPNIRAVLDIALTDQGHQVATAADAASTATCLESFTPNVALVDLDLYGRSGLDVAMTLRQQVPGLPVLAMSADFSDAVRATVRQAGCAGFVEKPFDFRNVAQVIDRALAKA